MGDLLGNRVNQQVNQQPRQMGLRPKKYDGLGMLVEYTEAGQRYREGLGTILITNGSKLRHGRVDPATLG
jgi:hypothetical protein